MRRDVAYTAARAGKPMMQNSYLKFHIMGISSSEGIRQVPCVSSRAWGFVYAYAPSPDE